MEREYSQNREEEALDVEQNLSKTWESRRSELILAGGDLWAGK